MLDFTSLSSDLELWRGAREVSFCSVVGLPHRDRLKNSKVLSMSRYPTCFMFSSYNLKFTSVSMSIAAIDGALFLVITQIVTSSM